LKKLTKILLINWLYFSKQVIELGDVSFITGKTGAGKSTIIDALQIVLLGELSSKIFNKAANESSQRTLDGYLRADMDDKNPRSRRGKDFSSYIACQFLDDQTGSRFVAGIVFDCRSDGSRREQFFIYDGVIPEHCFLIEKQAMDISALRGFLKGLPAAHETLYDTHTRYRADLLAKWNVHDEQVCRMLKKAVSFKPIVDIQQFITENVCDIQEKPDIEAMQQNIRDYKRHEMLARRQEDKVTALTDISRMFREMQASVDRLQIQSFLVLWAEKAALEQQIEKLAGERQDYGERLAYERERYDDLENDIKQKEERKNVMIADRAKNDAYQEKLRLMAQEEQLKREHGSLTDQLNGMALEIKREAQVLCGLCDTVEDWPQSALLEPLRKSAREVLACCQLLSDCTADIFAGTSGPFEKVQKAVHRFSASLREAAYRAGEDMIGRKHDLEQDETKLAELSQNIKDYPKPLLALKGRLEEHLSTGRDKTVNISILADVLEIAESEELWRGAVEGYLHTQKFYLLVDPALYTIALSYYNRVKREYGSHSFGLVDVGMLRDKEELSPREDSLAQKVQTDDSLARSYVDYLLGRVICCDSVDQIREHRIGITAEGMLYQGYVARPIPKSQMEDAFIGRKAIALRIEKLKERMAGLREEILLWEPVQAKLDAQKNRDFLFTQRFVQETAQSRDKYSRKLEISLDLENILTKMSQLDLFWADKMDEQIKQMESDIGALRKDKENCVSEQTSLSHLLGKLENEDLPDKNRQLSEDNLRLSVEFPLGYRDEVGFPRYAQELERLRQPLTIAKNFREHLPKTENEVEQAKRKLIEARHGYVRDFQPCSYRVNAEDNDEFDAERILLEESELPRYREKIKLARESALEQFQNDFLNKLMSSIKQVQEQVRSLNKALRNAQFGTDQYQFRADRSPDYAEYYDMIMAPEHLEGESGLFSLPFQQKYGHLIEDLFSRIATSDDVQVNARAQSELQQNIERYTDFRTYLKFDLETTDQNGSRQLLSQTLNTKSGGETQTPFYIAVLASFAQLYRVNDYSSFGNTARLVIFDEAFNKMDSERIIESIRLLRKMNLQAIISTPPEKLPDIAPEADRSLMVYKEKYTMQILPYSKEIADTWSES
jgi:uncharacterized protein YPO0396